MIKQFRKKPSKTAYADARRHAAVLYQRVRKDLKQMRGCLASGFPFVFGFTVYTSFESDRVARTGHVPMPARKEKEIGGHAVVAVGYDNPRKRFIVRNSWGADWGLDGYFTMPYDYLLDENLSDDFWTIKLVQ